MFYLLLKTKQIYLLMKLLATGADLMFYYLSKIREIKKHNQEEKWKNTKYKQTIAIRNTRSTSNATARMKSLNQILKFASQYFCI